MSDWTKADINWNTIIELKYDYMWNVEDQSQ